MCFLNMMNLVSLLCQVYFKCCLFSAELFLLLLCDESESTVSFVTLVKYPLIRHTESLRPLAMAGNLFICWYFKTPSGNFLAGCIY